MVSMKVSGAGTYLDSEGNAGDKEFCGMPALGNFLLNFVTKIMHFKIQKILSLGWLFLNFRIFCLNCS